MLEDVVTQNPSATNKMWHKVNFKQSLAGLNSEFMVV